MAVPTNWPTDPTCRNRWASAIHPHPETKSYQYSSALPIILWRIRHLHRLFFVIGRSSQLWKELSWTAIDQFNFREFRTDYKSAPGGSLWPFPIFRMSAYTWFSHWEVLTGAIKLPLWLTLQVALARSISTTGFITQVTFGFIQGILCPLHRRINFSGLLWVIKRFHFE